MTNPKVAVRPIEVAEYEALKPERMIISDSTIAKDAIYTYVARGQERAASINVKVGTLAVVGGYAVKLSALNTDLAVVQGAEWSGNVEDNIVLQDVSVKVITNEAKVLFRLTKGFLLPYMDGIDKTEIFQTVGLGAGELLPS